MLMELVPDEWWAPKFLVDGTDPLRSFNFRFVLLPAPVDDLYTSRQEDGSAFPDTKACGMRIGLPVSKAQGIAGA